MRRVYGLCARVFAVYFRAITALSSVPAWAPGSSPAADVTPRRLRQLSAGESGPDRPAMHADHVSGAEQKQAVYKTPFCALPSAIFRRFDP